LLVLSVMLWVFTDPWSTLRNEGDRIALKDRDGIDRIFLSDGYDSTLLMKENDMWLLFGEEPANPVSVENLLFAAERLQINSIVSEDSGSADRRGRSVQFFEGEKLVLEYKFLTRGSQYMVNPAGSDQTYFISIAGYGDQNLEKVFSSAANHYREHLLIDLIPSEISLIEIELAGGTAYRFTQDEQGSIACLPSNPQTVLPSGSLDDLATRLLFSYFTSIRYEQRAGIRAGALTADNDTMKRMATLHVESHNGIKHTLQVFPFHETPSAEAHMFRALVIHNNDPEVLVVNYIYLDVLMRDLSHYFGEK